MSAQAPSHLSVVFWNINGLNNLYTLNIDDVPDLLSGDVICLCETWCHESYGSHKIVVIGDFNAHIGLLNQLSDTEDIFPVTVQATRNALHVSTNSRGSKLVEAMENLGFYMLNGRTYGDIPGNYTYLSTLGKSTIDLAWLNTYAIDKVSSFTAV